jgi:hypothetical protein
MLNRREIMAGANTITYQWGSTQRLHLLGGIEAQHLAGVAKMLDSVHQAQSLCVTQDLNLGRGVFY